MGFKIPFTVSPPEKLIKKSKSLSKLIRHKKDTALQNYLESANTSITREQYLGVAFRSFIRNFLFLFLFFFTILFIVRFEKFLVGGAGLSFLFSGFILFSQLSYPRVYAKRRELEIEKNLMPALEDFLVQLNSGIPLFSIMVNLSVSDYGELSIEFKKIVRKINAGLAEVDVLNDIGRQTSSVFFKRTLWQISNGLRAGSDMSVIIRDSIKSLSDEQLIQIQNYGNKLNPLIMFYMLVSVIVPALSITFLTVMSSIIGLPQRTIVMIFVGLMVFTILIQVMFIGLVKSARPHLL